MSKKPDSLNNDLMYPEELDNFFREQVQEQIRDLVSQSEALIKKAERLADKHNVTFHYGVEYGMGGEYEPNRGWNPSSMSC